MAVEKAVSYAPQTYQNKTDYIPVKKDIASTPEKNQVDIEAELRRPTDGNRKADSLENIPITLDDLKDKDTEKSLDEKIQDVIEDQKFVHDKIRKSLDDYSSRMGNYEAKFGMHEATNRVMIKLVNKDTKEVIKELPPEKTLDMIAKCLEQAGILVDEKV